MLGLGAVLEVSGLVCAIAKLALFVFSVKRKDGPAWSAFRWNVFFPMSAMFIAVVFMARHSFAQHPVLSFDGILLFMLALAWAGTAGTSFVLAFHLVGLGKK